MQGVLKKAKPGQDRGPHRPERPLPARAHGAHRHVRGEQVRPEEIEYPLPSWNRPEGDLRGPRLPGAGHGDGPGRGRVHPRPGRHPAPGHGEEEARGNAQDEGEVPRRRQGTRATTQKTAERIFELLFAFSGYGFNKSHAAAYTIPAYHTIWLKANHPAEFIAANCTNDMNDTDRLAQLIHEAREMGIEVLPPDVNLSQKDFTVENGKIVFGLLGIKNVGSGAVDAIIAERAAQRAVHELPGLFRPRGLARGEPQGGGEPRSSRGVRPSRGDARHAAAQPPAGHGALRARPGRRAATARRPCSRERRRRRRLAVELERQPELPASQLLEEEKQNLGLLLLRAPAWTLAARSSSAR